MACADLPALLEVMIVFPQVGRDAVGGGQLGSTIWKSGNLRVEVFPATPHVIAGADRKGRAADDLAQCRIGSVSPFVEAILFAVAEVIKIARIVFSTLIGSRLARAVGLLLDRSGMTVGQVQQSDTLVRRETVFVVEEQANPSSDYFVLPAVSSRYARVVRCCWSDLPASDELAGAWVVFVRYVPPGWARLVAAMRPRLGGVVYFMDDDLLDFRASSGMPLRYRYKLARFATWRKRWLVRMNAQLWVSTPWLQERYARWSPRLVLPVPLADVGETRRIFYHGSASHGAEICWLRPVVAEVLAHDERVVFEIVGGADVYRLYRGMDRVTVVHPMRWASYQAFLTSPGRHVGMVPLLDLPFNRARSYTKFFDITRCGAVGVYSSSGACAEVVTDGVDGLLVDLHRDDWVAAIVSLVGDEPLRQRLLRNAVAKQRELGGDANEGSAPEARPDGTSPGSFCQ